MTYYLNFEVEVSFWNEMESLMDRIAEKIKENKFDLSVRCSRLSHALLQGQKVAWELG